MTHKKTLQERAAKIIRKTANEESFNRMNAEIEILRKLNHPVIIKMYEYFSDENRTYLVLEKCTGGELFEEIEKKHFLNEKTAALICKQILSALAYLHENMIVHRDLKPENIMFEEKEDYVNIKIIDFGSAVSFSKDTRLKQFVGSAFYIAPEVARYNYDEKCDL